ncbi:MAG TPA: Uma2 family endonuclease [Saprospiraceae bacterium]|nr:Uma2 family endonuclease [Saprospiraceae bacterium]HMQ85667.1 Uma2 family endonuclease [Saprospiraceae bacterium]
MSISVLSAKLLKYPYLPLILARVSRQLEEEATRRQAFREWLDKDKKAEFINGEVVMHSPVKQIHLRISRNLALLLDIHVRKHKLGVIMVEKALIALTRNDYEPDLAFFRQEVANTFQDDQMLFPAPDFVVEILSKSTANYDRGIKLTDYAAHGVREYWIIDPSREVVEQYLRVGEDEAFMPPSKLHIGHTLSSKAIAGFEIPVEAIFQDGACEEALKLLLG